MGVTPLEWQAVKLVCEQTSARAADLIRSAPNPAAPVPGLDWTVADVAAHMVSLTSRHDPFVRNQARPAFESMPALNADELSPLDGLTLTELADRLERGTENVLALCPSGDAPAKFFDMDSDCGSAIALLVEELLVHGLDLASRDG